MPRRWKNVAGFVFCAIWLYVTVAFFAMLTSGGEAKMELEIGPFLKLQDSGAIFFPGFHWLRNSDARSVPMEASRRFYSRVPLQWLERFSSWCILTPGSYMLILKG